MVVYLEINELFQLYHAWYEPDSGLGDPRPAPRAGWNAPPPWDPCQYQTFYLVNASS